MAVTVSQRSRDAAHQLVPPHVTPPARLGGGLTLATRFLRNPLLTLPQSAYAEDFVAYTGLGPRFAWITGPDLIKSILLDESHRFEKSVQVRLLAPLLGRGILTSEGPDWKWQRQTSAPMFRRQELMSFVPTFLRATHRLLDRWRGSPPGSVQHIDRDMTAVTFDVICATLLPSGEETAGIAVEVSAARFQRSGVWRQLYVLANAPDWLPQPGNRRIRMAIRALRSSVAQMLQERREAAKQPDDLMHRLMRANDPETGTPMSDEQLIDNLLTFYLAGHETTSKALLWTLYLLACSPEWTRLLRQEIARVTAGAPVSAEHIDKLVLTQQVIKESMRLYPPVPFTSRQAIADLTLGSHAIKAGSSAVIPIYAIHRHQKRWQAPNAFDPTRFAPENESKISRSQYMPFGAGPRICIGMAFAIIGATTILATLLQAARFQALADRHPLPIARVSLHPMGGMPMRVWA